MYLASLLLLLETQESCSSAGFMCLVHAGFAEDSVAESCWCLAVCLDIGKHLCCPSIATRAAAAPEVHGLRREYIWPQLQPLDFQLGMGQQHSPISRPQVAAVLLVLQGDRQRARLAARELHVTRSRLTKHVSNPVPSPGGVDELSWSELSSAGHCCHKDVNRSGGPGARVHSALCSLPTLVFFSS